MGEHKIPNGCRAKLPHHQIHPGEPSHGEVAVQRVRHTASHVVPLLSAAAPAVPRAREA